MMFYQPQERSDAGLHMDPWNYPVVQRAKVGSLYNRVAHKGVYSLKSEVHPVQRAQQFAHDYIVSSVFPNRDTDAFTR